jgi:putative DNA methylase
MPTHTPFIETQFPLEILSMESYKERKANLGQTLTGLGKWWGRKPLILVRATILGLLLPASDDPAADRQLFLKILTMDEDGLWRRKTKPLGADQVALLLGSGATRGIIDSGAKAKWARGADKAAKEGLEAQAFARLSYQDKLEYCCRPEEIDGPGPEAWADINRRLGTKASSLPELFRQLSQKALGHAARVGDVFCGGGSIPFEAARLGLEAWGSDLNPVATLLTWAAVHLIGGGPEVQKQVKAAQEAAWKAADEQITAWGIEHDGSGNRADAYLYSVEAKSPATGLWVPLAPSWVIGERTRTVAILKKNEHKGNYDIEIVSNASDAQMKAAKAGTVQKGELVCPETGKRYSISGLRGDSRKDGESVYGLRLWENDDLVPRPEDTFQERLYCVRWVTPDGDRLYRSVTAADMERETRVLALLRERFADWQERGFIPSIAMPRDGVKTEEPIRTRGWTHWHHLFHPRQLLLHGLMISSIPQERGDVCASLLGLGRLANWNSRLCSWDQSAANEKGNQTFQNQALNAVYNFSVRPWIKSLTSWFIFDELTIQSAYLDGKVQTLDARDVTWTADYWITDPPYADAVNYHELADFFLAWYEKQLPKLFPEWYADSRSALAVKGDGQDFKQAMVDIYANLAAHMNPGGRQVVMFTHQDSGVWADLGMILWAAGLQVTAAWTIGTETTSGLKQGNYVQGTVLLVLRKRIETRTVWNDELIPMVDDAVREQMEQMRRVDDANHPQFGDTDYQLGAYAAALKVLTGFSGIEGLDIKIELFRPRRKSEKSEFEKIIERAVSISAGYLVPRGLEKHVWRSLDNQERLYLRGLELEQHREGRQGAYQELARGFGVQEYKLLLGETAANQARFKTPSEFKRAGLGGEGFGATILRHLLFAIHETARTESPREGLNYLKAERADYWTRRSDLLAILAYLSGMGSHAGMEHWKADAEAAALLAGIMGNDYAGS